MTAWQKNICGLVAKRKWLIWDCKEEKRERFLLCSGVVWTVPQEREEKREENGRKEHTS